jgi:hypothetical protein
MKRLIAYFDAEGWPWGIVLIGILIFICMVQFTDYTDGWSK